jgi:hypothetical protein
VHHHGAKHADLGVHSECRSGHGAHRAFSLRVIIISRTARAGCPETTAGAAALSTCSTSRLSDVSINIIDLGNTRSLPLLSWNRRSEPFQRPRPVGTKPPVSRRD